MCNYVVLGRENVKVFDTLSCGWSVVRAWLLSVVVVVVSCGRSRLCASVLDLCVVRCHFRVKMANCFLSSLIFQRCLGPEHDFIKELLWLRVCFVLQFPRVPTVRSCLCSRRRESWGAPTSVLKA